MKLLIDDIRIVEGVDIIARTSFAGCRILAELYITHLYLDNDLGQDSAEGHEILSIAIFRGDVPDNVFLITENPVAKKRMQDMLKFDLNYTHNRSTSWWTKKPLSRGFLMSRIWDSARRVKNLDLRVNLIPKLS